MESSYRRDIVSVSKYDAILRAEVALTGAEKKDQACAPFPERDLSTATGKPRSVQVRAKAVTSARHCASSKSTATNQHVSSRSSG